MALAEVNDNDVKARMVRAVEQEASQVEERRREARTLTVRKLNYRLCKTVAPLATDGERTVSHSSLSTWRSSGWWTAIGRLHFVKLGSSPDSPILPVDVPVWLPAYRKQDVLEYLVKDARDTFLIAFSPTSFSYSCFGR